MPLLTADLWSSSFIYLASYFYHVNNQSIVRESYPTNTKEKHNADNIVLTAEPFFARTPAKKMINAVCGLRFCCVFCFSSCEFSAKLDQWARCFLSTTWLRIDWLFVCQVEIESAFSPYCRANTDESWPGNGNLPASRWCYTGTGKNVVLGSFHLLYSRARQDQFT